MKVLLAHDAIQARVLEMGRDIARDYAGREPHLVCVLKGACTFMTDLSRAIDLNLTLDYIAVSSYGAATKSSGEVKLVKDLDQGLEGRDLLVVEDIVDTGLTLNYLLNVLKARGPRTLKVAALLSKPSRRLVEVKVDYVGFSIEDHLTKTRSTGTCVTSSSTEARASDTSGQATCTRDLGQATRRARRRCAAAATREGGLRGGREHPPLCCVSAPPYLER